MKRIFVKGDYHGNFHGLRDFCAKAGTTRDDIIVALGDFGVNYTLDERDTYVKAALAKMPVTFIAVHGNHEERPRFLCNYEIVDSPFGEGKMWHDPDYPNQYFPLDGHQTIYGRKALVIGGAYSVDKAYRLATGKRWFPSEQLSEVERDAILRACSDQHYDFVLTHTCPTSVVPMDRFLPGIEQASVDRTMEQFLQTMKEQITYDNWYCGHWHIDRMVDNFHFVQDSYKEIHYVPSAE